MFKNKLLLSNPFGFSTFLGDKMNRILFTLVLGVSALFNQHAVIAQEGRLVAEPVTYTGTIDSSTSSREPVVFERDVKIFYEEERPVLIHATCRDPILVPDPAHPGNGTEGNWNGFYNPPAGEDFRGHAKRLADSIKGIGQPTAEKILSIRDRNGNREFFFRKPRSWEAFANEIRSAQRALQQQGYRNDFEYAVLHTFRTENLTNLGYAAGQIITQGPPYDCVHYENQTVRTFARLDHRRISVTVKNAVLQSFENENYILTLGINPDNVGFSGPNAQNSFIAYNSYVPSVRYAGYQTEVLLTGVSRNHVDLPTEATSAELYKQSNGLQLNVKVESQYLPKEPDTGSYYQISYRVCTVNWFDGCFKEEISWTAPQIIKGMASTFFVPASSLRSDKKHKVWYKISRVNSIFYNGNAYERTTSTLKF